MSKTEHKATAVAMREESHVSDSTAIIQVIERAASNPNVDIDKMERLLQMQERILDRNAKAAYTAALADMQPELPVIPERGKINIGSGKPQGYALWEDINEAIKPILQKHGFALSFRTGQQDGKIIVTGVLSHREGHSEETTMHLPLDTSGSKNAVQAVGSSTSYGKRYTAAALLNLTSRGEDDDGKTGGVKVITEDQLGELIAAMEDAGADKEKFCAYFKIPTLAELPASKLKQAHEAIATKRAKK